MAYVYSENWADILGTAIMVGVTLVAPAVLYLYVVIAGWRNKETEKVGWSGSSASRDTLNIPPLVVTAKDVVYTVPLPKSKNPDGTSGPTRKTILNGISVCFRPGTLSAIMGPSGCGKTTFLNILADRQPAGGVVTGDIRVNGAQRGIYYKRQAAYVMQFDALFPFLTVREHLQYVASLRLEPSVTYEQREKVISSVISMVALDNVADSRIGDESVRGLSGGQKRRVTVATELVTMPSVLYLDEPTTGLDAYSSLSLVQSLKTLAGMGQTIVCTIHQPRPDIFDMFDNLLLMKSGEVGYFGSVQQMPDYLSKMGVIIPKGVNSADFVVDLTYDKEAEEPKRVEEEPVGGALNRLASRLSRTITMSSTAPNSTPSPATDPEGHGTQHAEGQRRGHKRTKSAINAGDLVPNFVESKERTVLMQAIDGVHAGLDSDLQKIADSDDTTGDSKELSTRFAQSVFQQTSVLIRRDFTNLLRSPATRFSYGIIVVQFLFYGLLFLGLRTQGPSTLQTIGTTSAFFFQIMNTVTLLEVDIISVAWLARTIFYREHASGAYSIAAYHSLWICRMAFYALLKAILYTMIIYWFPGIEITADRVFVFMFIMAVLSSIGSSLALLLVCAIPEVEGAGAIHSTVAGMMGTFAGFFIPPNVIPSFLIWLYYLSFYKYSFEALNENQYQSDSATVDGATVTVIGDYIKVDETLNRFTNIVVLCFYPLIFHAVALFASWGFTHKAQFKALFSFGRKPSLEAPISDDEVKVPQNLQVPAPIVENMDSYESINRQGLGLAHQAEEIAGRQTALAPGLSAENQDFEMITKSPEYEPKSSVDSGTSPTVGQNMGPNYNLGPDMTLDDERSMSSPAQPLGSEEITKES